MAIHLKPGVWMLPGSIPAWWHRMTGFSERHHSEQAVMAARRIARLSWSSGSFGMPMASSCPGESWVVPRGG